MTNADTELPDALSAILAVVGGGRTQSTAKYALLLVLVSQASSTPVGEPILLEDLAYETLGLYWPMVRPFNDRSTALAQMGTSNRVPSPIRAIEHLLKVSSISAGSSWAQAQRGLSKDDPNVRKAIGHVSDNLWRNPIKRLQTLPGGSAEVLFKRVKSPRSVILRPAVHREMVRHAPLLKEIIEVRFASFVEAVPRNELLSSSSSVRSYLFPPEQRAMPSPSLRQALFELQGGRSPYSGELLGARPHADHVLAWARSRASMLENFVLVPEQENSVKSDHLLAPETLERWLHWMAKVHQDLAASASKHLWPSDPFAHRALIRSQYTWARVGDVLWSPTGLRSADRGDLERACELMTEQRNGLG